MACLMTCLVSYRGVRDVSCVLCLTEEYVTCLMTCFVSYRGVRDVSCVIQRST